MTRRALTLIEVLAATVLLGILAVTCVPILKDATTAAEPFADESLQFDLTLVADRIATDQSIVGLAAWPSEPITVEWPLIEEDIVSMACPPLTLSVNPSASIKEGAWLSIDCGSCHVVRWIVLDSPKAEEESPSLLAAPTVAPSP